MNWIWTGLCVVVPSVLGTLYMGWRKFIAWITPKANEMFDAHTGLVNEMKTHVPVVSETLKKLQETQDRQCETLEQHGQRLEGHHKSLQEILAEVRKGKPTQS